MDVRVFDSIEPEAQRARRERGRRERAEDEGLGMDVRV